MEAILFWLVGVGLAIVNLFWMFGILGHIV